VSARIRLQRLSTLVLAGLCLCAADAARAQQAPTAEADMEMPDDLGKPLEGMIPVRKAVVASSGVLTLNSPIQDIAADPRGRAILQKDLPGLCDRPEFVMFKSMTLTELAGLSHGKLTKADLDEVRSDLATQRIAVAGVRRTHNPILIGGRAVGHVTHALYKRVVLVVASL
jgi:hypothetical protein